MGKVKFSLSMSLDGFIAGVDDRPGQDMGEGGEALHHWVHGGVPGSFGCTGVDREVLEELHAANGAMIVGRRMFDVDEAWGGNTPGDVPCFVLTHNPPQEWVRPDSPFTFVTDGIHSALDQARAAAGDKDVEVASANVVQQFLRADLIDEFTLHLAPILLGRGIRLFERLDDLKVKAERTRVRESGYATHISFRVLKDNG
ncbi:dihydrofolate reductase family protein [Actinokineospora diospyrosa]|uniref:Dihydrofolate reductase n=1 Tax=Actinokineospora diospyrosa TaxID=103728 RepID=A0ABT1IE77_9PSEU|nr:dihydrofolate reductase family protein [Actinokineospora diospyrosa]MCP2270935.1 Dihydrofolate reductase [Actinokineospora diospyrosa]